MNTRTFIAISVVVAFASQLIAQPQRSSRGITIVDQTGRVVPNDAAPNVTGQIFDVTVGPGGATMFSPNDVTISVGDTVRWTWGSDRHSVTSGNPCTPDSQFCSPNDMNCASGTLSNTGAVYQHTFNQAGTFSYFCALHCAFGMTGMVHVTGPTCTPPPSGMVGWFPGDGNARDIANGNNGTLSGAVAFAPGEVAQAFSFNGSAGQVTIAHNANQNPGNQITIDAWVYPAVLGHGRTILQKRSASNIGGYGIEQRGQPFGPDGALQFFIMISGTYQVALTSTSVLSLNTWQHVAATYDGSVMKIYVNGVEVASQPAAGAIDAVTDPIVIGRNVVTGDQWNGLIDEVELFNRALSQAEIQAIVNAGAAGKCKAPQPVAAVSRRVHGSAGTFDIDLNPNGSSGVECRTGPNYQMVVQFTNSVTVSGATLTGVGTVSNVSVSGNTVTVDLSGVTSAQIPVLKLLNVSDGSLSGDVPVAMGVLVGDTNGNRTVNAADVSLTKARLGQAVDATNFPSDVNANGAINSTDVSIVKSHLGEGIP